MNEFDKALEEFFNNQKERAEEMEKMNWKQRALFFKAIGRIEDGRRNPIMTEEEFLKFDKPCKEYKHSELKDKTTVEIYFKFEPYHDVTYVYCFEDDTVYENRFYIGE